jgi:rare lipoprotein A
MPSAAPALTTNFALTAGRLAARRRLVRRRLPRLVHFATFVTLAVSTALFLSACSTTYEPVYPVAHPVVSYAPPPPRHPSETHVTKASWYGKGFSGRRTATGERFDPNGLTAASTTLPLGSVVRVTNLDNGRSVKVRINDVGPYVRGRGLDLSHSAAQKIGMTRKGVVRVKVAPVRPAAVKEAADIE